MHAPGAAPAPFFSPPSCVGPVHYAPAAPPAFPDSFPASLPCPPPRSNTIEANVVEIHRHHSAHGKEAAAEAGNPLLDADLLVEAVAGPSLATPAAYGVANGNGNGSNGNGNGKSYSNGTVPAADLIQAADKLRAKVSAITGGQQ